MENGKDEKRLMLDRDDLSRTVGGEWAISTLTPDEMCMLFELHGNLKYARMNSLDETEARDIFYAFVAAMEAKYGPSGWPDYEWLS